MDKKQIDVLAVMDEVVRHLDKTMPTPLNRRGESHLSCEHHSGLRFDTHQVREAVAEVLKAADHLTAIGNREPEGEFDRRWARLRAALNRCARVRSS